MGMPIIIEIIDPQANQEIFDIVFNYFHSVDQKFSPFKKTSELTKLNQGVLSLSKASTAMQGIFRLAKQTQLETNGYFNIKVDGKYNPSGIVKGWAINHAAGLLSKKGFKNYYVGAGGDIQTNGNNKKKEKWCIGIQNPFNLKEIIKKIIVSGQGVATSGTYIRGNHIYNPHRFFTPSTEIVSLTVIGPNIYNADRFATAAFAMGKQGINFIEQLSGFEGYQIDNKGIATMTTHFNNYVAVE